MSSWECGVCGYIQKEGGPPEKCPICEAPKKMFTERGAEAKVSGDMAGSDSSEGKKWYCTVCGYVHTGPEPPEKCPVCGAAKEYFVALGSDGKPIGEPDIPDTEEDILPKIVQSGKQESPKKKSSSLLDMFGRLVLKFHLHPITVHFPNGILPAVLVFLGLGFYFNIVVLETVAYYNMIFALITLPVVLLTGYLEWQKRYKGIKTAVFITKIICGLVVLCSVNILVFWRLLDPTVFAEGSPYRLIYLGIAGVMVAAAGISGHLGGKLVFASRG
jgi:uncharacterized membrane protein/rubredoxin